MMRTTEERVAAVKQRGEEINRQKQRRMRAIVLSAGAVLAIAVIAALLLLL